MRGFSLALVRTKLTQSGLSDAEKHCSEREATIVTWSSEHLQTHLLGMRFTVKTDHYFLLHLLSTKALDELPSQILRFQLGLLKFSYNIVHVPRKLLISADTQS